VTNFNYRFLAQHYQNVINIFLSKTLWTTSCKVCIIINRVCNFIVTSWRFYNTMRVLVGIVRFPDCYTKIVFTLLRIYYIWLFHPIKVICCSCNYHTRHWSILTSFSHQLFVYEISFIVQLMICTTWRRSSNNITNKICGVVILLPIWQCYKFSVPKRCTLNQWQFL